MNAIELLIKDHEHVQNLLDKIDKTTERAVKSREDLFNELMDALQTHEEMEETYFYPELKEFEETQDLAYESLVEHDVVDYLLEQIEDEEYDAKEWTAKFTVLKEAIEHHVKEEENDLFPRAKQVFSKEELEEIGNKMAELKQESLNKN